MTDTEHGVGAGELDLDALKRTADDVLQFVSCDEEGADEDVRERLETILGEIRCCRMHQVDAILREFSVVPKKGEGR